MRRTLGSPASSSGARTMLIDAQSSRRITLRTAAAKAILRLTGGQVGSVFTLADLRERELAHIIADTGSRGKTPQRTLERVCQELRDAGMIEFVDDRGTYSLAKPS